MPNFLWRNLYLADAHSDFITACDNEFTDNPKCCVDLKRIRENIKLQVAAFFVKPQGKPWKEWRKICGLYDNFVKCVSEYSGVDILKRCEQLNNTRQSNLVLALEAADCFARFADKEYFLHRLVAMDFKILGLFWNNDNWIGCGADANLYRNVDSGLTKQGKRFLRTFAEYNIILDLAHSSERSFFQVAEIYDKPFMVSHACCLGLCSHRRNLSDEQLSKIGERGGYAGIALYPLFLNGTPYADLTSVAEHIAYAVNKAGIDCVGLGTDFDGTDTLPQGITGCENLYRLGGILYEKGFVYKDIEKIMGKNLQRFLRENLKE